MMCDDFGSAAPVRPYTDAKTPSQLMYEIEVLKRDNAELNEKIAMYEQAPLRRMWIGFVNFVKEWFGVFIFILIAGIGIGSAVYGASHRTDKQYASCEFNAKIQQTKFEFDKYNERCYLYDKKFERYIPYAIQNP
jgi:hypothetical protein